MDGPEKMLRVLESVSPHGALYDPGEPQRVLDPHRVSRLGRTRQAVVVIASNRADATIVGKRRGLNERRGVVRLPRPLEVLKPTPC